MDVDLLRPGTVPISAETVLWFEFLLNQELLQIHLEKPKQGKQTTKMFISNYRFIFQKYIIFDDYRS